MGQSILIPFGPQAPHSFCMGCSYLNAFWAAGSCLNAFWAAGPSVFLYGFWVAHILIHFLYQRSHRPSVFLMGSYFNTFCINGLQAPILIPLLYQWATSSYINEFFVSNYLNVFWAAGTYLNVFIVSMGSRPLS